MQDGLEFSSPRIHSPYYNIDDSCNPYAKDEKLFLETFQRHYNYPHKAAPAGATRTVTAVIILLIPLLQFLPELRLL